MTTASRSALGSCSRTRSPRRQFDLSNTGGDSSTRDCDLDPTGEKLLVRVQVGAPSEYREIAVRPGWAASLGSTLGGSD